MTGSPGDGIDDTSRQHGFALTVEADHGVVARASGVATFVARIVPPARLESRPPVRLVLAIDTSSSMRGEPLRDAARSARALVRALAPGDEVAVVGFDSTARVLVRPTRVDESVRPAMVQALRSLHHGLGTNLHHALEVGMRLASSWSEPARLLVLSDGHPSVGDIEPASLVARIAGGSEQVTVSTFGFGYGANAPLLAALSDAGRGHYGFIDGHEPTAGALGAELAGAQAACALAVELRIEPAAGVSVRALLRPGPRPELPSSRAVVLPLPPLAAGDPDTIVFELAFPPDASSSPLATVTLRARTPDRDRIELRAPAVATLGASDESPVRERVVDTILARASVDLERIALELARTTSDPAVCADDLVDALQRATAAARASEVADHPRLIAGLAVVLQLRISLGSGDLASMVRSATDTFGVSRALGAGRQTHHGGVLGRHLRPLGTSSQHEGSLRLTRITSEDPD